ncbi:hypothetical protein [Amycolatopsis sp. PS_44_ISF1]|uniref:hypothetical protein n=1 Tax=Amycolatopsis sp. PS_44_ISF1 TaxID=2974917 RepID=UPI0028DFB764|nr:hypothetical protein [Amycolatopsis sp. PS_44_ISF1]MDT8913563.1 hypothetical protein [Amycolatopsis sp. PS_44_ISF1]
MLVEQVGRRQDAGPGAAALVLVDADAQCHSYVSLRVGLSAGVTEVCPAGDVARAAARRKFGSRVNRSVKATRHLDAGQLPAQTSADAVAESHVQRPGLVQVELVGLLQGGAGRGRLTVVLAVMGGFLRG